MLAALSLILALTACVDEHNAELPDSDLQVLVVDGTIYSDSTCRFRLTQSVGLQTLNNYVPYVTSAKVTVKGSNGSTYSGRETAKGTYEVKVGQLQPNVKYWLNITTRGGITYESEPAVPMDAPSLSLRYEQNQKNPDDRAPVEIYISTQPSDASYYVGWSFEEWFEVQTPYVSKYEFIPNGYIGGSFDPYQPRETPIDHGWGWSIHAQKIFESSSKYVNNSIKNYHLKTIPCESQMISTCYYIKVRQEAVSKAEYEYEMAREKQTSQMGGLFTPQPSRLPSNIRCMNADRGVIGFVGVRGRLGTAEMYLNNKKQVKYFETRPYEIIYPEAENPMSGYENYKKGYYVLDYDKAMHDYVWITRWCVDCTSWGARQFEKPSFWNPTE